MTMATLTGRHDKPRFKQTLFEVSNLDWHKRTIIHSKDFSKKKNDLVMIFVDIYTVPCLNKAKET